MGFASLRPLREKRGGRKFSKTLDISFFPFIVNIQIEIKAGGIMKRVFGLLVLFILVLINCASGGLPRYISGKATATSRDLQLSIDKAKQDARLDVAEQLESHIQGLIKKFDEEVGRTEDSELLQQYTKVSKNVVDQTLLGSRVKKSDVKKEGEMYRAYVTIEAPLGEARTKLLQMLRENHHLYNRFRNAQSFKELEEEVEKLKEYKEEQEKAFKETE